MTGHIQKLFLVIALSVTIFTVSVIAQGNNSSDTLFIEITLTEENVVAVDTFGNEWYYDFENDHFVQGNLPEDIGSRRETDFNVEDLPVEERCVNEKKVKKFSSYVTVGVDEFVDGDIIASGRVTIKGWVKGDVTSINNRVLVAATGQVDGDINAEKIIVRDGGIVLGIQDEDPLSIPEIQTDASGIVVVISIMGFLFICVFLILALMPKKVQVVSECMMRHKLKMTLLGLLFFVLMPFLLTLATITIIGIVLLPFIILLYLFAAIVGLSVFCNDIGQFFTRKIFGNQKSRYLQALIGFSLFALLWTIAVALMSTNQVDAEAYGFGVFLLNAAIIFSFVPFFGGIGAAVVTRFGFRPYKAVTRAHSDDAASPSPPPIPDAPDIKPPPPTSGPYRSDEH